MSAASDSNRILRWGDCSWEMRFIDTAAVDPDRPDEAEQKETAAGAFFSDEESVCRITSAPGKGKVTDCGYDAFACCYTALPADREVEFRADIRITAEPGSGKLTGQEAFGLFLRDTMEKDPETGHFYSNMAAAGAWGGMPGLFGRDGITRADHGHVRTFSARPEDELNDTIDTADELNDTIYTADAADIGHIVFSGEDINPLHIELVRAGSTVSASITDASGAQVLRSDEASVTMTPGALCRRDSESVYAGFMAARGYEIEIIKDSLEIIIGDMIQQPAEACPAASGQDNNCAEDSAAASDPDPFRTEENKRALTAENTFPRRFVFASPDGSSEGSGTEERPYDLETALAVCRPGTAIRLAAGRYHLAADVVLGACDKAYEEDGLHLRSLEGPFKYGSAVLDFGDTMNCLRITGDLWNVENIEVTRGAGICIEGSYNMIRRCKAYRNNETGILIRHHDSNSPRAEWPSYNTVENCDSYENCDASEQHADGFACKVAAGEGNIFSDCRAYHNSDDGFDLFAKNRRTGAVTIDNCISEMNGYVRNAAGEFVPSAGNGNGYKLGGSGERVEHSVSNSCARKNKGHGFTNNSNPYMELKWCRSTDNGKDNVKYSVYSEQAVTEKKIIGCDFGEERIPMIEIRDICKEYRIGQIGHGTLQKDLQSWWARKTHREDPNSKLGQEQRLTGDILHALRGINLTVYKGERLGIIGGNGAGKSTLLKLISRVAAPTSGTIDLYGRVTSMLEVGTGFHGDMTGRENIYLNGAILGMSRREIESKMDEIIEFSGVRDYIDTPVKRYSSGMYVRLAFSVAAHLDSEIVIMDEVLAVGDTGFQKKCINKMRQSARDEDRTILYVSHNMNTVRELCDRCIVLAEGRIIFDGEVEDAIECYTGYLQEAQDEELDFLRKERRDRKLTGICRIAGLDIREETIKSGEELRFDLRIISSEDRSGVQIRLIVCNGPGEIVGMTYSDPADLREGMNTLSFAFPPGNLAPGEYVCDIAVFEFSGEIEIKHDFLNKVLPFRVTEETILFGRPWKIRTWGNVVLDHIRTEGTEHERQE